MTAMHKRSLSLFFVLCFAAAVGACSDSAAARDRYLASGNQYFTDGRYTEAVVEYRNAIQQDPLSGEARLKLAETYQRLQQPQRAFAEYVRAADLLPDDSNVQLTAGAYLLLAQRYEDAKTRAEAVLAKEPRNVTALLLKANSMAGLKDVAGAVTEIEEALALGNSDGRLQTNLGMLRFSQGQGAEAEAAFKQALEADPKWVPARLALASFYWSDGQMPNAEKTLKDALALEPNNVMGNRMLARLYIAMGRAAEAEQPLKTLASSNNEDGRLMLADFYIQMKRPDDAAALLRLLAGDTKTAGAAAIRLAVIDRQAGRRDAARQTLEDLLKKEPRNVEALTLQADWRREDGDAAGAVTSARAATEANPAAASAHFALGRAQAAQYDNEAAIASFGEALRLNPRAVAAQVELSKLQLTSRNVDTAVELAREAIRTQPENPAVQFALVRGLLTKGDLAAAEPVVRSILTKFPQAAVSHAVHGRLLLARNDAAGARAAFERALARDPDSVEALEGLLTLDIRAKQLPRAVARIEARASGASKNPALHYLAALTYGASGQLDKTETSLRRVIEVAPDHMAAYLALGRLYIAQKRLDAALAEFDGVVQRQPSNIGAATMAGMILEAQNKRAEAQKRYEAIVAQGGRTPVAANNLAWIYAETGGNLDTALQLAQLAKSQVPASPEISDTVGWIYYKKDLPLLAIPQFQESAAMNPKNALYHFHLGLAYSKAGRIAQARTSLEQALQLNPNFDGADLARKTLSGI
jgi:tetratricopeptide (TPR) repeat protein